MMEINIIQNIEKLITINSKKNQALENLVNNDKNFNKIKKSKENEKNNSFSIEDGDDEEKTKNNNINNHKTNICKTSENCKIQKHFINKNVEQNLINIKKYQILLQGLLDIYSRKKEHIYYLGRLHSQKCELEKQKELNNSISYDIIKNKGDELKSNISHQIKFINKINKDLKYEIEKYKENEEDIYFYINSIFKDKANTVTNFIKDLNNNQSEDVENKENDNSNLNKEKNKTKEDENEF